MGHGRLQVRDEPLNASAEKRVENHGGDADGKTRAGVYERLADSLREQNIAGRAKSAPSAPNERMMPMTVPSRPSIGAIIPMSAR